MSGRASCWAEGGELEKLAGSEAGADEPRQSWLAVLKTMDARALTRWGKGVSFFSLTRGLEEVSR